MHCSRRFSLFCAVVLIAFTCSVIRADEGGWKMPNLNPFTKKTPAKKRKPSSATVSDNGSGFQLPKVPALPKPSLPSFGSSPKRPRSNAKKEPSMMTKMSDGTKNFFAKSYDVLTPWDNDSDAKKRTANQRKSSARVAKKESWFDFSKNEDEHKVEAVNDFLKMPRPDY